MTLAPIIVFCYNRPWHVEQMLEALSKNVYADESVLYIFCDGPKPDATEEQINKVLETRVAIRRKQWCKELHIVEAEKNKGLANSIIDGVTQVINKHGKVIVLEDDLVTSPYFLKYMNEALEFYDKYPAVFSISANRPPMNRMHIPEDYEYDVFVSLRSYSTGWATWKEKWDLVDWSLDYLEDFIKHPQQVNAFNRGGDDMTNMLLLQRDGKIDSWAIRYGFAHFMHHAVAILPCVPYVDNIGFDGSGVHCGTDEKDFRNDIHVSPQNFKFIDIVYEDSHIINCFYNYYTKAKRPIWKKVCNSIFRMIGKPLPFIIKKTVYKVDQ